MRQGLAVRHRGRIRPQQRSLAAGRRSKGTQVFNYAELSWAHDKPEWRCESQDGVSLYVETDIDMNVRTPPPPRADKWYGAQQGSEDLSMEGEPPEFEHTASEMGRHRGTKRDSDLKEPRADAFAKGRSRHA